MINAEQLKAVARFLEELTDLSLQTGVSIVGTRPDIEINGEELILDVTRDAEGQVVYSIDLDQR
ncbi:MAG: hypothetical protein QOE61_3060 [Micromonosporaceae bacterium]|jgi:hypothetical protein|nr:hypothetical protein [Micromonosporaceae bacterium]